jgi:hypothetical protein
MPFYVKLLFLLFYTQSAVQFTVHFDDHTRTQAAVVTKARRAEIVIMKPKENTMIENTAFADALDAVEHLDPDAQAELIAVLNRRLAERGRERIAATVEQARREFASGQSKPMTASEIVGEALS